MSARLSIRTLGGMSITLDETPFPSFHSRKTAALLIYLAAIGHDHPRDVLAEMLWEGRAQAQSLANLRVVLTDLRQSVGAFVRITREAAGMALDARWTLDAAIFEERLTAGKLDPALTLYQGDFLAGFYVDSPAFEDWASLERERLRFRAMDALDGQIAACLERGTFADGIAHATRLLQMDPLREETHQAMMTLLAHSGQRTAALAQFETCRTLLDEELGIEPSAPTAALAEQIRAGEIAAMLPNRPLPAEALTLASIPRLVLPRQATSFIGRADEIAAIVAQVRDPACRLLTLVGPGGIGKTRLALAAAERATGDFGNGIFAVELAPISEAEAIVSAIAAAVGFQFYQGPDGPDVQLIRYLRDKTLLLVLDNFDHLLDGVGLVERLLSEAPGVTLLATSREPLKLSWEWVFPGQGLTVAAPDCPEDCDALRLFVARARQRLPGFDLGAHRPAVAHICQLVEGMPLAIELAAAWVGTLAVETIAHELAGSLDLLETEARDVPDRHRSIRAAFDPTWQRLSATEQEVFARLSVFRGGFTREAAREVAGASLRILMALVEKSLVWFDAAKKRYSLHEFVRQYGEEQLTKQRITSEVWHRHLSYFTAMANDFRSLKGAKETYENLTVLNPMEAEIDNFGAALDRALELEEYEPYLRLLDALNWFLVRRNHFQESQRWNEQALSYLHLVPLDLQGRLLRRAGDVANRRGDYTEANQRYQAASRAFQEIGDQTSAARLKTFEGLGMAALGRFQEAAESIGEALRFHQANGNRELQYETLHALGMLALYQDHYQEAEQYFERCQEISQEFSLRSFEALAALDLALAVRLRGDFNRARSLLIVTLPILYEVDYRGAIAECLMEAAAVVSNHGCESAGVRLAAAANTLDIALGLTQHDVKSEIYRRELTEIRAQLDPDEFEHLWDSGAALSPKEAVALAQAALADLGSGEG